MVQRKSRSRGVLWTHGPVDRSGLSAYVHLIRCTTDPERLSRAERRKRFGEGTVTEWSRKFVEGTEPEWKERIMALLSDNQPRTFNRIVLELTQYEFTADVAAGKAPDNALWELVDERKVCHTFVAPVLFRRSDGI